MLGSHGSHGSNSHGALVLDSWLSLLSLGSFSRIRVGIELAHDMGWLPLGAAVYKAKLSQSSVDVDSTACGVAGAYTNLARALTFESTDALTK